MGVPAPTKMVEAFAINAPVGNTPGGKTVPFPVASQIPLGQPGRASLNDGYTTANMTPLASGGSPMSGPDTNGILYLLSTTIVAVDAGQIYNVFDGTYATAIGGYAKGAVVQDTTNLLQRWTSAIAANTTDPAVTPANWVSSTALYAPSSLSAGTYANNTLSGPSDFIMDITATGAVILNGFVGQRDGQKIVISNLGTGTIQVGLLVGAAGNQVRGSGGSLTLLQNDSVTLQFVQAINSGAGGWIII
jgi:hypothetical protein